MATETGEGSAGESESEESAESEVDDPAGTTSAEEAPLTGDPASETETGDDVEDESEEAFDQFTRSIIVTTTATLLGLVAGVASMLFATTEIGSTPQPDDLLGVAILVGAVFVQFPLYAVIGLDPEDFETKTQIYVFVMTFFMWFITWTVLLTTGGLL